MESTPQARSAPSAPLVPMDLVMVLVVRVQLEPTLQSLVSVTWASAHPVPLVIIAQQAAQPKPSVQLVPTVLLECLQLQHVILQTTALRDQPLKLNALQDTTAATLQCRFFALLGTFALKVALSRLTVELVHILIQLLLNVRHAL